MHFATELGQTNIIEKLLFWASHDGKSVVADPSKQNILLARTGHGDTGAHLAAERGHSSTLQSFLSRGVPVFMPNKVIFARN